MTAAVHAQTVFIWCKFDLVGTSLAKTAAIAVNIMKGDMVSLAMSKGMQGVHEICKSLVLLLAQSINA